MSKAKVTQLKKITLADLKPKPYKLQLDVPGHPDLDVWVSLVSVDSKEYQLGLANLFKNRGVDDPVDVGVDEAMRENAKLYTSVTLDWGPEEFFGVPYSQEAGLEVMSDFDYKWITSQIEEAINKRENFFTQ